MRFKEKLKKIFKYSLLPITMVIALIFAFAPNTYAYELTSQGDIISSNLLNNVEYFNIGNLDIEVTDTGFNITGQSSINWNKYIQYDIYLNNNSTGYYNLSYNQNPSSIVYIFVNNTQVYGDGQNVSTNQSINFNVTSNFSTISLRFYQNCNVTNLRLTKGIGSKTYEKFGIWYNQNSSSVVADLFGGCKCELYNSSNNTLILTSTFMYSSSRYVSVPSTFSDYMEQNDDINYKIRYYLNQSTHYILKANLNNTIQQVFIRCINSYNNQTYTFTNSQEHYYYIECNTQGQDYNIIEYDGLNPPDYSNIELYVFADSYSYEQGYNSGFEDGHNDGFSIGYNIGSSNGKNQGYEEGYLIGSQGNNALYNMILAIVDTPITIFKDIFDFNVLGIDLTQVVFSIVTLLVTIYLIKKIK